MLLAAVYISKMMDMGLESWNVRTFKYWNGWAFCFLFELGVFL